MFFQEQDDIDYIDMDDLPLSDHIEWQSLKRDENAEIDEPDDDEWQTILGGE